MAVLDNIESGYFTSTGTRRILDIRCDLDQIVVINQTEMAATNDLGVRFEWYRGMPSASQMRYFKSGGGNALNVLYETTGGFSLIDTSQDAPGAAVAVTDISNATPPVVSTASTAGLANGDVVRIVNAVNGGNYYAYNGIDYTIASLVANTSFTLAYMAAAGNADTAQYRRIPYNPIYYPRRRVISRVTTGVTTEIFMTVTHEFTVGQRVTFSVSSSNGMIQLNGLRAQILAINTTTNSITVNIDSTGFTAYSWPSPAATLTFTPGQVIPFGDAPLTLANPGGDQSVLDGATDNRAQIGILLDAGNDLPAGNEGDVIRWIAYKSSLVQTS